MQEKPSRLLWVFFLAYFTFGMITNVLGVVIPEVKAQYQLSYFAAGFLAFGFFIAYGIFSIPAGLLMDRLGAKPLVLLGVILMALGCLVIAWAQTYPLMLAMIFAVGVGVTILQTAGNPLIQHLDRPENYHRNLTLTIGFCGIGAFLGPFLLAFVRGMGHGWQALYVLFTVLCVVLMVPVIFSRFPATATGDKFRADRLGRILNNPLILLYTLGVFFYVGAEVGTASWIVSFFDRVHGLAPQPARVASAGFFNRLMPTLPALVVALFWGLQGIGRLVSGAVLNTFGSRRILRLYSFMTVASLLAAIFGSQTMTAVGFAACGFFTSVLITLIISGTINTFAENHGTISGLLCTAIMVGALLPPMAGLVGDHYGMRAAMMVPLVSFVYVFLLALFGRARYEESNGEDAKAAATDTGR